MTWRRRLVAILLVIAAALSLLWAFLPRPVAVETAKAVRGPLIVTVEEEGRTRLRDRFVVSAPVAGYARRVSLEVGDAVRRGQVLAELEPPRTEALDPRALAAAEARLSGAEASLQAAEEKGREATAADEYASAKYDRTRKLAASGLVSKDVLEQAESEFKRARAARGSAEQGVDVATHERDAARTLLMRAGEPPPRGQGRRIPVRSPVTGRVLGVRHKSEGAVAAGTPLLEVGNPDRIEVEVDVLSADAVRIRPGTRVRFFGWGGEIPLDGAVRDVQPVGFTKVSALGVEEQRVLVIADITSPADRRKGIGDGYRVEAQFILWEAVNVLQVPAGSLFRSGERYAAYVVEKGRARARSVEIGKNNGMAAQVISGISEGETVILHPGDLIGDGTKVRPR